MHELFADWYAKVDLQASPELLARRWACVEAAVEQLSSKSAIALARTFLELPSTPTNDESPDVVRVFKGADQTFPMTANRVLVKVLAGASLAQAFEEKGKGALEAALATLVASCNGTSVQPLLPDIIEMARSCVAEVGLQSRADALVESKSEELKLPGERHSVSVPPFQEIGANQWNIVNSNFQQLAPWLTQADNAISTLFKSLSILAAEVQQVGALARGSDDDRVAALREECEILWWLFGGATDDGVAFSALSRAKAAILCALELTNRTRLAGPVPAGRAFLDKALRESSGAGELTLADLLEEAGVDICMRVAKAYGNTATDVWAATPVLLAATKGAELKNPRAWLENSGLRGAFDADYKLSPGAWALQLYYECLLARAIGTHSHD